ncbi:hypothetical protein [Fibrobacter sp.]|uniref:hypothetical protein n=1 Tax=Fibrobacter sp. TaxID=35828 RepID=UPI00386F1175
MFYKHWKKIALSLTALFWASCDDSASSAVCLYGPDPNYSSPIENPVSSSSVDLAQGSSSSEKINSSSSEAKNSSSSKEVKSSSSIAEEPSSSSEFPDVPLYGVIGCVPMDSSVTYFSEDYSVDIAKMWKEEAAKHAAVDIIDSIKQTLAETPKCLEDLRSELDRFVALYGAPTIIMNAVESCEDGTIQPSEEYAKFLKMKEEWEANKSALEEELQKTYEDKLKEIEQRINKCLNSSNDEIDK